MEDIRTRICMEVKKMSVNQIMNMLDNGISQPCRFCSRYEDKKKTLCMGKDCYNSIKRAIQESDEKYVR